MGSGCSKGGGGGAKRKATGGSPGDNTTIPSRTPIANGGVSSKAMMNGNVVSIAERKPSADVIAQQSGPPPQSPGHKSVKPRPDGVMTSQGYGRTSVDYETLMRAVQEDNYASLKQDFMRNQKLFLVNQLMMSVQFFRNFEKDKEAFRSMKCDTEDEIRECLADRRQTALISNVLFHKIHDNVGFRSFEQNNVLEQLLPTEYYINYDFIETNRKEDYDRLASGSMDYSQLDVPYYRTCIEQASNIGFSKIRCVDDYDSLMVDEETPAVPIATSGGGVSPEAANLLGEPAGNGVVVPPLPTTTLAPGVQQTGKPATGKAPSPESTHNYDDHFPSHVDPHKQRAFHSELTKAVIPEDQEDEEIETHASGTEYLHSLRQRVMGQQANFSSRQPPRSPIGPRDFRNIGSIDEQKAESFPNGPVENGVRRTGLEQSSTPPDKMSKSNSITSLVEDAYGYVTTRPKSLSDLVAAGLGMTTSQRNALPSKCFKKMDTNVDDDEVSNPYPVALETETKVYISSRTFMQYFALQFYDFCKRINKGHLHQGARLLDPRIMCHEERPCDGSFAKESRLDFIPTITVGFWPDEGIEWYLRKRLKIRDKRTNAIYQWPSPEIVSQAQQIGCNLVPVGYFEPRRTKGRQALQALEESTVQWEIHFSKFEELIQRNLNHPKIRCHLFFLLLYRTFLADLNTLTPQHLRYNFYWMVEKNPAGWIEEKMGGNLMEMIKEMKKYLKNNRMPHYFISRYNMFEAVPRHKITKAHEKFHRLQENVVPYLMSAIKRLHIDKFFYPLPDIDELYNILTVNHTLALINPALLQTAGIQGEARNAFERSRQVTELTSRPRVRDAAQERMRALHRERVQQRTKAKADEEQDAISLNMIIEPFDNNRARLVLEFFIGHFIALAKKSNEFSCHGQGLMYIMHADNLIRLLNELKLSGASAHMGFQTELEQLKQVTRGTGRDYWNVSWGTDDRSGLGSSFRTANIPMMLKAMNDPLPKVPSPDPSPSPNRFEQPSGGRFTKKKDNSRLQTAAASPPADVQRETSGQAREPIDRQTSKESSSSRVIHVVVHEEHLKGRNSASAEENFEEVTSL